MNEPTALRDPHDADAQQALAERFAPVIALWPEIPAQRNAPLSLRDRYAR